MGEAIPVGSNFDQGFQSDISRDELAQNAAFRMRDFIPQLEAPLRKRGGWSYGSNDLGVVGGLAASVASIGWLPFAGDGQLVAISDTGTVYQQKQFDGLGGATLADSGDTSIIPSWPVFWHKDRGIILPGLSQGAKVPKKYVSTGGGAYAVQPIGGTPPMARTGFSWGDYLALLNYYDPSDSGNLHNNRIAFSGVGNADSWTLSGVNAGVVDFPEEIIAATPVRNAIMVWGYNDCHLLTGDTPPPGGNLQRRVLFAGNGTFDGRSVARWRDYAIWANASGVWKSDGATLTDLTASGGISVFWRQIVSGFAFVNGWNASAGIYRDHYIISVRNNLGALVSVLACDLSRNVWSEWQNIPAALFVQRPAGPGTALFGGDEELFFAHTSLPRVGRLSTLWTPSVAYARDADGSAVLASLETPYYKIGGDGYKRLRRVFVSYDLRTDGALPMMKTSYVLTPEPGALYVASANQYPPTTAIARKAIDIRRQAYGAAFKFEQTAAAADWRIYSLEMEAHPQEGTR